MAAVLALGSANAQTVLDFTASGTGGTTTTSPTSIDTNFALTLSTVNGLSASSFSVAPGDEIQATINFSPSASISIPSNATFTVASLDLFGTGFDGSTVGTTEVGTASATLGGISAGGSGYSACTTNGLICDPGLAFSPGSINFDTYKTDFKVDTLDGPVTINSANFDVYTGIAAVPEPQTFALMAFGLAMLWFAARRFPPPRQT